MTVIAKRPAFARIAVLTVVAAAALTLGSAAEAGPGNPALHCFKAGADSPAAPADLRERFRIDDACAILPRATHVCLADGGAIEAPPEPAQFCYRVRCPRAAERRGAARSLLCVPTGASPATSSAPEAPPRTTTTTTTTTTTVSDAPYGCCEARDPQFALCYSLASAEGGAQTCRDELDGKWIPGESCNAATGACGPTGALTGPCCQLPDGCQAGPSADLMACSSGGFGVFFGASCIDGTCVP